MNIEIIENGIVCGWIALLVYGARRNSNLQSILLVLLAPKVIDVFILTHISNAIRHGEYRHFFFLMHSANDALMIALLCARPYIHIFTRWRCCFERLWSEWFIVAIYFASIIVNLLVFNEYLTKWAGEPTNLYFYNNYETIKRVLFYSEALILSWLTIQTLIAVRNLKRKGLIK
uniref:Uncharacterized protein n=1 Tax=viral metagenome TaxID=1070528 RepID=A0A6M3J3U7_9ZZZZ